MMMMMVIMIITIKKKRTRRIRKRKGMRIIMLYLLRQGNSVLWTYELNSLRVFT